MRNIFVFLVLFLTTACTAKLPSQSISEKSEQYCNDKLIDITINNLNLNNINKKNISLNSIDNNTDEEIIQVFVASNGSNNGAVLGSIKINKIQKKISDITDDEDNEKPMKLGGVDDYLKECIR